MWLLTRYESDAVAVRMRARMRPEAMQGSVEEMQNGLGIRIAETCKH
jgi:hypothetical protein